jgi:exodeoxyribonuclease VII large subunit
MNQAPRVYLEVPFAEKDDAKSKGARWDAVARKWFIGGDRDLAPFLAWLPDATTPALALSSEPSPPDASNPQPGITLSLYLSEVGALIQRAIPKAQWVRAEISQLRPVNGGQLALELVEHDEAGRLTARTPAFLWNPKKTAIEAKFETATGASLSVGLKVLLQVTADFNSAYGFRTLVEDIDPSFTLGDIEAKLKAIRDELIRLGIFEANRKLETPIEFTRVAVISPKEAAGLGDFRQDADHLEAAGVCQFQYYTATFQGSEARNSLLKAFAALQEALDQGATFDALCIIRGGGAVTDLYWLNELELASTLCQFKLPVFTGIGHERDNTILDEVAHRRFDTPSKVIGHIAGTIYANTNQAIEHLMSLIGRAQELIQRETRHIEQTHLEILQSIREQLLLAEHGLTRSVDAIRHDALEHIHSFDSALDRLLGDIDKTFKTQTLEAEQLLETQQEWIHLLGWQKIHEAEHAIEAYAREVLGVGPEATLKRGFSLARSSDGQPITSRKQALKHPRLDLEFHDGHLVVATEQLKGDPLP